MRQNTKLREVLVVDDDPVIRNMMIDIFNLEGYPIRVARNGREALEMLHGEENYLVFLDLLMPVMDGKELCQALEAEPQLSGRHVIIMMSAMDQRAEVASLNVNSTISKPFSVDDVMDVIRPYM